MSQRGSTHSDFDSLYDRFVVAMQRTGSTKEALRETLRAAGSNQPGGRAGAETDAQPSPSVRRIWTLDQVLARFGFTREELKD